MWINYVIALFVNLFFFLNNSVRAENFNYINGNTEFKITQRIDNYFTKYPTKKRVLWLPEIKGKSRYAFSIPKDAYLNSKKYLDASDLYYLSKKIDKGLKFQSYKSNNINLFIVKDNHKVVLNKRFASNINVGMFLEKKEKSLGVSIDKDFILSKNVLGNFAFKQHKDDYTILNARFVKLMNNENSELSAIINHKLNSSVLDLNLGYTWFEIANNFDFTAEIKQNNNKLKSDIYASFGEENVKLQVGLNDIKGNSDASFFVNLRFEDIIKNGHFGSNIYMNTKNEMIFNDNLSLKKFRKQGLDSLWRKHLKF